MSRANDVQAMIRQVLSLSMSLPTVRAVVGMLHEGKTAREIGAAEGKSRAAILKRLQRLRAKAKLYGVEIPAPKVRRRKDRVTLAAHARRAG
ncbi:MAG TPA: hypothetical protein VEA69_10440 [Tepidisphaeraceae bacterium]|nr:hypothetical protein [Tepidisphaeraceae bacterium]